MKKITFIILCLSPLFCLAQQKIYQYKDKSNRTIYSDIQPTGNLPTTTINIHSSPKSTGQRNTQQNNDPSTKDKPIDYQLAIKGVENGASFRSNDGNLTISLSTSQAIPSSAQFQLLLDGKVYGSAQSGSSFSLVNIDRGEHTAVGQIVENGTVIQSSTPISFTLQKISVNSPARAKKGSR